MQFVACFLVHYRADRVTDSRGPLLMTPEGPRRRCLHEVQHQGQPEKQLPVMRREETQITGWPNPT